MLAGPGERQVVGGSRVPCAGRRFGVRPVAQDWREFAGGRKFVRGLGAKCEKRRVFEVFGAKILLPAGRNFPAKFRWPAGLMSWGGRATCGGRPRGFTLTPRRKNAMIDIPRPKFAIGRTVATPGAMAAMEEAGVNPAELLKRHVTGDWGDVCEEDEGINDEAIDDGTRILSVYKVNDELTIWVITEADRPSTCLLLPEEY